MKYFKMVELFHSATARQLCIDNTPPEDVKKRLIALVENVLDPAREAYGNPVIVSSGYRCKLLNKAVGGVDDSQHLSGEAADITTGTYYGNKWLFEYIKDNLKFDQLIDEKNYRWIHVSYSQGGNRMDVLHQ